MMGYGRLLYQGSVTLIQEIKHSLRRMGNIKIHAQAAKVENVIRHKSKKKIRILSRGVHTHGTKSWFLNRYRDQPNGEYIMAAGIIITKISKSERLALAPVQRVD